MRREKVETENSVLRRDLNKAEIREKTMQVSPIWVT